MKAPATSINAAPRRTALGRWVCGLVAILISTGAGATPVAIVNPGFESDPRPDAGANDNFFFATGGAMPHASITGWTMTSTQTSGFSVFGGISDVANGPVGAVTSEPFGFENNIAWMLIENGRTGTLTLEQTLTAMITANTLYTLTLRVADPASRGDGGVTERVFPALGDGVNTGDVFARLRAGNGATGMPGFLGSTVSTPPNGGYASWTLRWQTGASESLTGQPLVIQLFDRAANPATEIEAFFDDVALDATVVPEPSPAALLLVTFLIPFRRRPGLYSPAE